MPIIRVNRVNLLYFNNVVDRKVIKQTVMTSVYGVTRSGSCLYKHN